LAPAGHHVAAHPLHVGELPGDAVLLRRVHHAVEQFFGDQQAGGQVVGDSAVLSDDVPVVGRLPVALAGERGDELAEVRAHQLRLVGAGEPGLAAGGPGVVRLAGHVQPVDLGRDAVVVVVQGGVDAEDALDARRAVVLLGGVAPVRVRVGLALVGLGVLLRVQRVDVEGVFGVALLDLDVVLGDERLDRREGVVAVIGVRLAELLQELEPGIHSPVPPQKRGCLWKAPRVSGGCEARQAGRIGCGGRVASGSDRLKRRLPKRWLSESPAWGDQSAPGDRRTEWSVWVYPDPPRLDPSRGLLPQVYPQYLPRATRRRTSRGAVELPNGG